MTSQASCPRAMAGAIAPARRTLRSMLLLALCATGGAGLAQESPAPPPPAARPQASEPTANAARSLLLGVADSGEHLFAVGAHGLVLVSNDAVHWAQLQVPVDTALTGIAFADAQHGWAVGHDAAILHSDDGGRNWRLQNFQPELQSPLFAVAALDAQRAVAVGAFGLLLATADGGAHWGEVDAAEVRHDKLHLNAITRLGDGKLLLAGENGLLATSPDGAAWQRLPAPYPGSFFGVLPWHEHGAVAFGLRGNVYLADDVAAGQWRKLDIGTTQSMFSGARLADGALALVGGGGAVVVIGTDGQLRKAPGSDAPGGGENGTYAGAIPWKDGLIAVGEPGVLRRAALAQ